MITQNISYYDNFNIKTFSEYSGDVLVLYEEYNKDGLIIFSESITGEIKKFEYDTKKRVKRFYYKDAVGNISWKKYTYSKKNLIVLHRKEGNPSIIHKIVFGPKDNNGERQIISENFL